SWSSACPNQNTSTGLTARNSWVAVMHNYRCSETPDFIINESPPLQATSTTFVDSSCNGYTDAHLLTQAIARTQPYAYAWNSVPAQNAALATGLPAGTFTLTVTDVNGCQETMSAQLVDPPVLIADIQVMGNNICFGDSAGVAVGQGIGGTSPYTY